MLGIQAKDIVLLFAGVILALPVTAGWQATKAWITRRGRDADQFEQHWIDRLASRDEVTQRPAYQEVQARALYNFILGNVMFAVSGLAWIVDPFARLMGQRFTEYQGVFAALTSFAAVIYFSAAMRWLRRLLQALRRP